MGVSKTQHERVLSDVSHILYQQGVQPTTDTILRLASDFFAQNPTGMPLSIPYQTITDGAISNVDTLNVCLAHMLFNFEVLYDACLEQVDDIVKLNQTLRLKLKNLKKKRDALANQVQDFLLAQFNTDGYFISISDAFADTGGTDLNMSSVFIDTDAQQVTLPAISNQIVHFDTSNIALQSLTAQVGDTKPQQPLAVSTTSPMHSAFDNLAGTAWVTDVSTSSKTPVTLIANFALGIGGPSVLPTVTRIEFTPYGVTPAQVFFASAEQSVSAVGTTVYSNFGGKIAKTSGEKIIFSDTAQTIGILQMVMRKDTPDYVDQSTGKTVYHYVFGAKEIGLYRYNYDDSAVLVSVPLSLASDLAGEHAIDAISVTVDDTVPADSSIVYYVANDPNPGSVEAIGDLDWHPITPLGEVPDPNNIIHFGGAQAFSVYIRSTPQSSADLQLISMDSTNLDPTLMNPSPAVFPGLDIYRLALFQEDVILTELLLEEGINSTRIYYTPYNVAAVAGLDYWQPVINAGQAQIIYGRIDTGNEFFYGGDIGIAGVSVYVETFLGAADDVGTILGELRKSDPNSQQWDVRVLQNGRDIGFLPVGTDTAQIPWNFQQGLNHISLLINIPPATTAYPNVQVGTINLLGTGDLFNYGTVKLDTWSYVDPFNMQYNQTGTPNTFTFLKGEIISRRKPTTNFRLSYSKKTATGPQAIRFRADLARSLNDPSISPTLNSYRVRFAYANSGA